MLARRISAEEGKQIAIEEAKQPVQGSKNAPANEDYAKAQVRRDWTETFLENDGFKHILSMF